ncbi:MAG: YaiI/YqxD family protein [Parvularculaceae bacterium]
MRAVRILVDADACPVKDEIYKVALRHQTPVTVVTNGGVRIPDHPLIAREIVSSAFDAADDLIAAAAGERCIVVTGDILLAERCLKLGASVIAPNGKPFTTSSIGSAIAMRAIMADIRGSGDPTAGGGARPFSKEDRSRFLQALDSAIMAMQPR